MIRVRFISAERENLKFELSDITESADSPISGVPIAQIQDKIKASIPIFNYASFFGEGLDLDDATIELGDDNDYYGYIPQPPSNPDIYQELLISFADDGKEPPQWEKGITIEFNKCTCREIYVIRADDDAEIRSIVADDGFLPEKCHIVVRNDDAVTDEAKWGAIKLRFLGFATDCPINIKGITLGKVVDVSDIMSFDMILETNPISDDLAINEMNLTATVKDGIRGNEEYLVRIYDNYELLENDVSKSIKEPDIDIFEIKSQSKISLGDDKETLLFQRGPIDVYPDEAPYNRDWNNVFTVGDVVNQVKSTIGTDIIVPDDILNERISPFYAVTEPVNVRKILQQLAWATCCRIDTSYSDCIEFVPVIPEKTTKADITIIDEDDRILSTSVENGEKYSEIVWKIPAYERQYFGLGEAELKWNGTSQTFEGTYESKEPFFPYASGKYSYKIINPYLSEIIIEQTDVTGPGTDGAVFKFPVTGYKYIDGEIRIPTGIKSDKILTITDHLLYALASKEDEENDVESPVDIKKKLLEKWYSNNNTLSATVVDNDSEIRLGKIINIQLNPRRNENGELEDAFFQGIVTKVVRNNIGDYHTVDLEAHEWN